MEGYSDRTDFGEIGATYVDQGPPYRLRVEIYKLPDLAQHRLHWWHIKKAADSWRTLLRVMVPQRFRPPVPLMLSWVWMCRESHIRPDYENLGYSFKPVLDALCKSEVKRTRRGYKAIERANVLEDDAPQYLVGGNALYSWEKAPIDRQRIVVKVEEDLKR